MVATPLTADVGLTLFFIIGLLGGAHCLGMCGPLVTLYADRMGGDRTKRSWVDTRQHLLFNLGRTASYATIGAIMGTVGALAFDVATITGVAAATRSMTGVVVGAFIVVVGVGYVVRGTSVTPSVPVVDRLFGRVHDALTGHVDEWVRGPRIVALGAVHGFLPCPILYPAFLYALARGSPLNGALSLGVLGLGTIPTLFAYGTLFQSISPGTRVGLQRVLGVGFISLGYIPLSHGLMLLGVHLPHPPLPFYDPLP